MTTSPHDRLLELHVLNGGCGESVVLRLPSGGWGVVDCCASSARDPATNPAVQLLKRRNVAALEFLCLTHPHADHFRGMSHFFDEFAVRRFWRFNGMTQAAFLNLLVLLKGTAKEEADQQALDSLADLQRTLRLAAHHRQSGDLDITRLSDIKSVYRIAPSPPDQAELEILSIAPSSNGVEKYEESLKACFTKDGRVRRNRAELKHNTVSVALLIRYGSTRVVLGGDVESPAWLETMGQLDHGQLAAHAVKVSHHGSTTGYAPGLWAAFARDSQPYAVITPSRRHGLPETQAIRHIAQFTPRLMATCEPSWDDQGGEGTDFWEDYPLDLRLGLLSAFHSIHANRGTRAGVCSLAFDDKGNCVSVNLSPPARQLAV